MKAKDLLDEVAELRLLVDSLCAAVLDTQKDSLYESVRQHRAGKAKYRGLQHVRDCIAIDEYKSWSTDRRFCWKITQTYMRW